MAAVRYSQSSRTTVNGKPLHSSKTRADSLTFAIKLQTKLYALSFGQPKGDTRTLLLKAAGRLNIQVEKVLIGIFGGGKISETAFNFIVHDPKEIIDLFKAISESSNFFK